MIATPLPVTELCETRRMAANHTHELLRCPDCDDGDTLLVCPYCENRRYYEQCRICGEPMGNARRKWKREQQAQPSPS